MKSGSRRSLLLPALTFAATVPAVAHHSYSMFDMEKDVTYKGTVVEYKWTNPHVHLIVDVKPGDGIDPESVGPGTSKAPARTSWDARDGPGRPSRPAMRSRLSPVPSKMGRRGQRSTT